MKFACLIFAYKDPEQVCRTVNALGDMDIYIHVDKKCDIKPFRELIKNENVKWVEDRIFVCWGGYSQFEAFSRLLECLEKSEKSYDRVLVLTALDYPILQANALELFFSSDPYKNYCTTMNISRCDRKNALSKIQKYWFYDIKIKNHFFMRVVRKIIDCFMTILYVTHILKKEKTLKVGNDVWDVYFGSESCCLTYDCIMYMYGVICENKEIEKYFRHSFAPIELITATILSNSKYKSTIEIIDPKDYKGLISVSPLYYMEYDEIGGTGMKVLDEKDFDNIIDSGKPFCRKVSSAISLKLEDRIDNMNKSR